LSWVVLSPTLGSVTAKQALSVPLTMFGIARCCWSSVPNRIIGSSPKMLMWTAEAPLIPAPLSAIACIITAASVMPRPEPPNFSGMAIPSQPASASER
jgi:hypothetical protein